MAHHGYRRGVNLSKANLQAHKQNLVRSVIFEAAIELFSTKGFDETTVEEVAQAAGVSRRSFFRYFASKDDLLAQNVVQYGVTLTAAIAACPASFTPLEIVRETVLSVAKQTVAHPRTRQVIEISERSASARQAHLSRLREVEDRVATAYAGRLKGATEDDLRPRLLASLTLSVMSVAIFSWYRREYRDVSTVAKQVFSNLTRIFCDEANTSQSTGKVRAGQERATPARTGSRKSTAPGRAKNESEHGLTASRRQSPWLGATAL
jgi:AcrR family transcriptional regulator